MDFSKYNPMKKKDPEARFTAADYDDHSMDPDMTCVIDITKDGPIMHPAWMASTPVILLIEYLKKYPDQGVILFERCGIPGLGFKPGLNAKSVKDGRGQAVKNTIGLFIDAADDLKSMIAKGIEIPLLIHENESSISV